MVGDSLMIGTTARTRLIPLGGNRFRVGRTSTEITFNAAGAAASRLTARTRGGTGVFERAPLAQLDAAALGEYTGSYRNEEIETTYVIAPDSSRLIVTANGRRLTVLEPTYRDGFAGGLFTAEFQRNDSGRIVGLLVQSGRVRNLRFEIR